jgi:hypothetical protein
VAFLQQPALVDERDFVVLRKTFGWQPKHTGWLKIDVQSQLARTFVIPSVEQLQTGQLDVWHKVFKCLAK